MLKPFASITDWFKVEVWLPAIIFSIVIWFGLGGLWLPIERGFIDWALSTRLQFVPLNLSPRIFPIDLSDSAERSLGTTVDSRQAFVDLLTLLGDGQLVVGMDLLFAHPKDRHVDAAMAAAASKVPELILAVVPIDPHVTTFSGKPLNEEQKKLIRERLWHPKVYNAGSIPVATTFLLPYLELARNTKHFGHIASSPDSDGVYRKIPLFFQWEDGYVPSLALALAAQTLKFNPDHIVIDAGNKVMLPLHDGPLNISVDEAGRAWIPYPNTWDKSWKHTPLDRILAAQQDDDLAANLIDLWDGGVLVVADVTTAHKDFGRTSFESIYPLSGTISSMLNGIITKTAFIDLSLGFKYTLSLILLLTTLWINQWKRLLSRHTGMIILVVMLVSISSIAWFYLSIVPWLVTPIFAVFGAWLTMTTLQMKHLYSHSHNVLPSNNTIDALTGLRNRHYFDEALKVEYLRLTRSNSALSLLMFDIDHFDLLKRNYGQRFSDICLKNVGAVVRQIVKRSTDIISRYDATKFICILPDTNHENTTILAERLRQVIAKIGIEGLDHPIPIHITASFGVITAPCIFGKPPTYLTDLLEQQLRLAKVNGYNCICAKESKV
ncbi:hypothetical protein TI04_09225 [Achromatium sp. WMS2]|nr:hypothetical protein TI04_09225 [Achromatium sp. WMS2]